MNLFNLLINKLLHLVLTIIIVGYIIFEELVWERFAQPIIRFFTSLKILQRTSQYLQSVNSKVILTIFVLMFVIVELLGLFAATQFVQGKVVHGILVYAGKIPVSAFTFWLFKEVKPKLMEFMWFKRAYNFVLFSIERIVTSEIYLNIKAKTAPFKDYLSENLFNKKGFLKQKVQTMYLNLRKILNRKI